MFHNPRILYITEFYSIRSLLFQTLSIRIVPVALESASDNKHTHLSVPWATTEISAACRLPASCWAITSQLSLCTLRPAECDLCNFPKDFLWFRGWTFETNNSKSQRIHPISCLRYFCLQKVRVCENFQWKTSSQFAVFSRWTFLGFFDISEIL